MKTTRTQNPVAAALNHLISPEERLRVAMAIQ